MSHSDKQKGEMFVNEKLNLLTYILLNSVVSVLPELRKQLPEVKIAEIPGASEQIVEYFNRRDTLKKNPSALESLFNRLNGNKQNYQYAYHTIHADAEIPCPEQNPANKKADLKPFADAVCACLPVDSMIKLNRLLDIFEQYTAYLPYAEDISIYDNSKLCCAIASCLYECISEKVLEQETLSSPETLRSRKIFLLYSFDTSGIQSFIYTITSKNALKGLRARSFYLEMMMETVLDELLSRLELSHANVIYSGGGHAYLLLPDTENVRKILQDFMTELHEWLLKTFRTSLHLASGMHSCSVEHLANIPENSYREIFRDISMQISEQKMQRYSLAELIRLNQYQQNHERECEVCRRSDFLTKEDKCTVCAGLEELGTQMISADYFLVTKENSGVILPFGYYLRAENSSKLHGKSKESDFHRIYVKNRVESSDIPASKLWIGDYASAKEFEILSEKSTGISRLGVLRADVDNLGQAFVAGFPPNLMTLSRTSAFSRNLSQFFKLHINHILQHGNFSLNQFSLKPKEKSERRNAAIVYAGGDDVFIVGAWDEIISLAIDLHKELEQFSQGTLSISAGIGMFKSKYPISAMARETGELEDCSKQYPGKNAVTLFDENNCYSWEVLSEDIIGKKMALLKKYLKNNSEHGNALLYQIMTLIREINGEDRLNIARFAYLLARLRPEEEKSRDIQKQKVYQKKLMIYQEFADNLYQWIQEPDGEECRKLLTAIQLYVYLTRDEKE